MGSLTDFMEKEVLDHCLKVGSYSPPATVYVALWVGDPLDTAAGGAECTAANGYAREAITFAAASSRAVAQTGDIEFGPCVTTSWGTVTHYALMTAITGGDMMAHGSLNASKEIVDGNTPTISSGAITITLSAGGTTDAYGHKILDWLFRAQTLTQATDLFVSLLETAVNAGHTAADLDDLDDGDYSRQTVNAWDAAAGDSPSLSDNTNEIDFGSLSTGGETVTATAISSVASGAGDILFYDNSTDQLVTAGDTVKFLAGAWDVTLD